MNITFCDAQKMKTNNKGGGGPVLATQGELTCCHSSPLTHLLTPLDKSKRRDLRILELMKTRDWAVERWKRLQSSWLPQHCYSTYYMPATVLALSAY